MHSRVAVQLELAAYKNPRAARGAFVDSSLISLTLVDLPKHNENCIAHFSFLCQTCMQGSVRAGTCPLHRFDVEG